MKRMRGPAANPMPPPAPAHSLRADLRAAFDDADAVALDMLRAPRRRNLGPRKHRQLYQEARGKLLGLLAELDAEERGDPAGSGGSGAE